MQEDVADCELAMLHGADEACLGGMLELSDDLLLDGVRRGDEEAFGTLFLRHRGSVFGVLLHLLGRPDEAEDLTQETFVRLFERPPSNGRAHNVNAWLCRVALNLGYNTLRAQRRRGERQQRVVLEVESGELPDPAGVALRSEERELVRMVLGEMAPNYQAVLVLRHQGFPYARVAEVLGIAPNAVGTVLARAEKQFKARYLQQVEGQRRNQDAVH